MVAFLRTVLAVITAFVLMFFLLFLFIMVIGMSAKTTIPVKDNSLLVLKLDDRIPERTSNDPFANIFSALDDFDQPVSLKTIVESIEYAKEDDKIKGIYLQPDFVNAGYPTLEAIRNALIDFKSSGKFIYSYSEIYTQKGYYLASVADSIFINSQGAIAFNGFHSEQIFLKGTLDKLKIEPRLIRAGKYKSAGETFVNEKMSDANREQLTAYVQSTYNYYLQQISAARNIPAAQLNDIANQLLVRYPKDAVQYKLADKLVYEDEVIASIKDRLDVKEDDDVEDIALADYAKAEHPKKKFNFNNKIALIYAVGEIYGGEGSVDEIGSEKIAKTIRDARENEKIKAIVLRINSPGGSALASDVIWREVVLAQKVKPVVASFGDLAASGGYYIAAPADYIVSEPNTITGSIGVFGLLPGLETFWKEKLGITFDRVKTSPYADLGNPNRAMTADERQIIQDYIDMTYEDFKKRVAEGRKLPMEFVDSIAQGRIYSGLQAKQIGLVDSLGGLDAAIAIAVERAELDEYSIKVMPEYKSSFSKMLMGMSSVKENFIKSELGDEYEMYKKIKDVKRREGVLMYLPFEVNL